MEEIEISWHGLHFGEEPPISGKNGSGTIFFCRCNLSCVYCQNWQISQKNIGCRRYGFDQTVQIMLDLQNQGAHNINLVSPTVWAYWLLKIIPMARKRGLRIPFVWNSNGYDQTSLLKKFDGLIEIYLPDYKYAFDHLAAKYSKAINYSQIAQAAIFEMKRQVGDLVLNKDSIAQSGLIVRHLVIPAQVKNSLLALRFIRRVSENVSLSLMSQYNPVFKANLYPKINRTLKAEEYNKILVEVQQLGFKQGWTQEFNQAVGCLNPDFGSKTPFDKI